MLKLKDKKYFFRKQQTQEKLYKTHLTQNQFPYSTY